MSTIDTLHDFIYDWGGATNKHHVPQFDPATRQSCHPRYSRGSAAGITASLGLAAAALNRGHNLVWFPEGRISRNGRLQDFHPGIGLLLQAHSVPVIPIWIEGTDKALPFGTWRFRPRQVSVHFGPPVKPEKLSDLAVEEAKAAQQIATFLRDRVARVEPSLHQQGEPHRE